MNYIISKQAEIDLEKIWLYTFEEWSLDQADYYLDLLLDEIEHLTKIPQSGKDYNEIRKGYFRSRVKFHFIFYKVNLKEERIEIIRILHERMDIENQLGE